MFDKPNDPPCPRCGCNSCPEVAGRRHGLRWGQQYAKGEPVPADESSGRPARPIRRQCDHCGHEFLAIDRAEPKDDSGEVLHAVLRCPHCHSHRVPVTRTIAGTWERYHKCADCGLPFKSRSM